MDQIPKKHFVSTAGHSKLQKIAFEKISGIFSVLSLDDVFFPKRAVVGSVARLRATPFLDAVTVRTAFQGFCGVTSLRGGQQQFATQTLRVHLLEPFVLLAKIVHWPVSSRVFFMREPGKLGGFLGLSRGKL